MATTVAPGWRKQRWGRRMEDVLDSMTRRAQQNGLDVSPSSNGKEPCAVCGQTVDRFHPLHRKERPDRSEAPVVRGTPHRAGKQGGHVSCYEW